MKILYLSKGDHVDYQDDCLCIGLKELFGSDVVDINKRHHIYNSYSEEDAVELYGMGMSVTRVLDDLEVDRSDIGSKIKNGYFDYVVYGSIWRCSDYFEEVLRYMPMERVVIVDGEDETVINAGINKGVHYFKRELIQTGHLQFYKNLHPISFAIPTSKLNFGVSKTRDYAICDPADRSTYIYKNEHDYYHGYAESRLAYTRKKAGWDCMRHYEILANGCIPVFLDIDKCPHGIMVDFPKSECIIVNNKLKQGVSPEAIHEIYGGMFNRYTEKYLTTKALATKFINTITLK